MTSSAPQAARPVRRASATATRATRMFLAPKWLLGHLVVLALSVTMVLLGRWQLDVSNTKGFDLQNFGYSLQWWAFTAFGLLFWARIMRDHWRRSNGAEPTGLSRSGEIVRSTGPQQTGPALLATRPAKDGAQPAVYRGYVLPNSAASGPSRSHGDAYHDSYNDYLWQLSLADGAERRSQQAGSGSRRNQADVEADPQEPAGS